MRLKYAVVSNKGGALLVSENAGDGKTSLLARLRDEMSQQYHGNCRTVFIDHPTLTANQMVTEIARQIGVPANTTDKLAMLNELRDFLLSCHLKGEKCVVMLDEGQMLCHRPDILQELRILLNFCVADAFLLTFILCGQKPLDEAIRAMPEFYQRLPVRFFLGNLNQQDTSELIRFRLQRAGNPAGREIFSEDGYRGIFNFSKGCPRVICSVADLALVIAHSRFTDQVDFVAVSQACSDMNRTDGAYHYFHFLQSFSSPLTVPVDPTSGAPGDTYCSACGTVLAEEAQCCTNCGWSADSREVPPAQPDTTVPTSGLSPDGQSSETPQPEPAAQPAPQPEAEKAAPAGVQEIISCSACGSGLAPQAKFCHNCGLPVAGGQVPAAEPESAAPSPALKPAAPAQDLTLEEPRREAAPPADKTGEKAVTAQNEDETSRPLDFPVIIGDTAHSSAQTVSPAMTRGLKAGQGRDTQLGRLLKFVLDGEDSLEEAAPSGSEMLPPPAGEPAPASAENDSGGEAAGEPVAPETHAAELKKPAVVKCSFCGLDLPPGTIECPNCGENLSPGEEIGQTAIDDGMGNAEAEAGSESGEESAEILETPVRRLLGQVAGLNLGRYIVSRQLLDGDRGEVEEGEEILRFPLKRFLGASAVLQYAAVEGDESLSTRCGLVFTASSLRIQLRREFRELPYDKLLSVSVDQLRDNGTPLLSRLIVSAGTGVYRIALPFNAAVGLALGEALRAFLHSRMAGALE